MGKGLNNSPASNTAAVINIGSLGENGVIELEHLTWSYDGVPASPANIKIESPVGTVIYSVDEPSAGIGFDHFSGSGLAGAVGAAMRITAAAGGSGVTCKVNVIQRMDSQGVPLNKPAGA
jgi:hypothetical protein